MNEICSCCSGDPSTVCDACGQHACWAGRFMCEDAQTAGTVQLHAELAKVSAPVDWPARFYASADAAMEQDRVSLMLDLGLVAKRLANCPPDVAEAICRHLRGEVREPQLALWPGNDGAENEAGAA